MLITLEEPFKSIWRKGYLQTHPSGRKYICLFNSNKVRTITSYARYLKSVELGYIVPVDYEVDHVNEDPTDDSDNNLQLLTPYENNLKAHIKRKGVLQTRIPQTCLVCTNMFYNVKVHKTCGNLECLSELKSRIVVSRLEDLKSKGMSNLSGLRPMAKGTAPHGLKVEQKEAIRKHKENGSSKAHTARDLKLSYITVLRHW